MVYWLRHAAWSSSFYPRSILAVQDLIPTSVTLVFRQHITKILWKTFQFYQNVQKCFCQMFFDNFSEKCFHEAHIGYGLGRFRSWFWAAYGCAHTSTAAVRRTPGKNGGCYPYSTQFFARYLFPWRIFVEILAFLPEMVDLQNSQVKVWVGTFFFLRRWEFERRRIWSLDPFISSAMHAVVS